MKRFSDYELDVERKRQQRRANRIALVLTLPLAFLLGVVMMWLYQAQSSESLIHPDTPIADLLTTFGIIMLLTLAVTRILLAIAITWKQISRHADVDDA